MTEKNLTEAGWKDLAKTRAKDLASLFKCFDALSKAEKRGGEAELEVLKDIEKEVGSLRKANKADKDFIGRLDDLDKALDKQRKAAEQAQAEQERVAAKQAAPQEEDDTPDLLTAKTAAALKEVRKGTLVAHVLIARAGKEVKVMVSKKPISPARGKVLKEAMENASGLKFIRGECLFENATVTFVVQTQAAGLAKLLNKALLEQLDRRMKVRVRGEDPSDIDEDPDAVDDEDGGQPAPERVTAEKEVPAAPDPLQVRFEERLAKLEPLVLAALRTQRGDPGKIRAVADFARGKGESGAYAGGLQSLDALEKLLAATAEPAGAAAAAVPPAPPAVQPAAAAGGVDPNVAFTARLTALMPKVKEGLAVGGDMATDLKLKISEAGMMARKRDFGPAQSLLDDAEELLAAITAAKNKPAGDSLAAQWESRFATTEKVFLRVLKGNPANASALRTVMVYATEQAENKDYTKALAALTRLDGLLQAADVAGAAGGAGAVGASGGAPDAPAGQPAKIASDEADGQSGERPGERGYTGIVAYRKSLVEFNLAAQRVKSQIASLKAAIPSQMPDESDLADELSEELNALTTELMDAVDAAMKTSENTASPITAALADTLKGYADEVASSDLIDHVDNNPFGVAVSVRQTLGGALSAVRAALPAPAV